ncbi:MAG: DUF547 domain-containing protein [Myxococcota bacterium]|nr:DUF547 domain-containing protein [Myxococcota bacterium]
MGRLRKRKYNESRRRVKRTRLLAAFALAVSGCVAPSQSYWLPETQPVERFDYAPWDRVLRAHVVGGVVDYPAIARNPDFPAIVAALRRARFTQETTAAERLAFWINAYNVSAVAAVLAGESPATLYGRIVFLRRTRHDVGGDSITLWDLEHARLRPLGDPRIHFALVCASASCPRLASQAYLPSLLDAQLEVATRAFVNDPTKNRYDSEERVAYLSELFDFFPEDFAGDSGSVASYVAGYVEDPAVAAGLADGSWEVRYTDYDWSLNGKPLSQD